MYYFIPSLNFYMKKIIFVFIILMSKYIYALDVTPGILEFSLLNNETKSGYYTIKNDSNKNKIISTEIETYYGINVKKWLKIKPINFILKKGECKKIYYQITLPDNMKEESCAHIFFTERSIKSRRSDGMGIVVRIGSSIYLSTKNNEIINPEFKNVLINYSKDKKLFLNLDIRNRGNVHLRFFYKIEIYKNKKKILKTKMNHITAIIPGANKKLKLPLTNIPILKSGKYQINLKLYYGNVPQNLKMKKFIFNFTI